MEREDRKTVGHVAFATVEILPGSQGHRLLSGGSALEEAMRPGTMVTRFGREWLMAQYSIKGRFLTGRIGFQAAGTTEEVWNEKTKDFEIEHQRMGSTSPFAIRLPGPDDDPYVLPIVYQLRPGRIRPTTFTGNFQALLNAGFPPLRFRVTPLIRGMSWDQWQSAISRVTEITIRVDKPNPRYRRKSVERLIEDANAEFVRMVFRAPPGEGLDISDEFIQDGLDHALAHGYGSVRAKGEEPIDEAVGEVWDSKVDGSPIRAELEADPETREVRFSALEDAVASREGELPPNHLVPEDPSGEED